MKPVVLYEDNHLLVVDKPHGLLTQPSGTDQPSLEVYCKQLIKERDKKPGNVFLHAVHRLDKPVGGVVLFAKSSKALSRLNASLRQHAANKQYEALVEGKLKEKKGTLEHFLVHDHHRAKVVSSSVDGAKLAKLHYEVIEESDEVTKVAIELETGRYHQIRVQFAYSGHPIVGDEKYGSTRSFGGEGIALVHKKLTIEHPVTKETLHFAIYSFRFKGTQIY